MQGIRTEDLEAAPSTEERVEGLTEVRYYESHPQRELGSGHVVVAMLMCPGPHQAQRWLPSSRAALRRQKEPST